jgi:thiol-disulfide isomerase/thioredoxin
MLLRPGSSAPLFKGTTLDGKPFDLAACLKRTKALILDFWQTGCGPCREELPGLEDLQKRYASQGLKVVTVNTGNTDEVVADFARKTHLGLPIVVGISCKPDVVFGYKASTVPTTYLIDSKGIIVGHPVKDSDLVQLEKDLGSLGFKR